MPHHQNYLSKQLEQWQLNDSLMLKNHKLIQKFNQQQHKKNIALTHQQQKHKSRPQSSPSPSIQVKISINQLRQMVTQEKLQAQKIQNRLKYLHTSTERQEKLVNSAKEKFYKITEVRRQSFTEKSFFSKERKNLHLQHQKTVFLKASNIKSQRIRTTESQQKALEQKKSKALTVKKQRQLNQSIIHQQKQHERLIRSQKAIRIKQQQQLQHQRSVCRSRQRIQQGVRNHQQDIIKQYKQVECQMKTKKRLMKSFEEKACKIFNQKQKQQRELEQYRVYLGLNNTELNSSRVTNTEPMIDDTMLFKARHKQESQNSTHNIIKKIKPEKLSPYSRPLQYKTKGNTEMNFYVTNPEDE